MKNSLLFAFLMLVNIGLFGQSTLAKIHTTLQMKCMSCHNGAGASGGFDVSGSATDLYGRLVNVNPTNAAALAKGHKLVSPGRTDLSFLFRKLNDGFDAHASVALDANEGSSMPMSGTALTNEEKEYVRQWILFGAKSTGNVPNEHVIPTYYNNPSIAQPSFLPNQIPAPPAVGDGFQIKVGPFFLDAVGSTNGTSEAEFFSKYKLNLPSDMEVYRINTIFAPFSHHLIMYTWTDNATAAAVPLGFRDAANHNNISLVYAIQEPTDLVLPNRTAFTWASGQSLDLNTHYINYGSNIYMAEAYINVYTQPVGTAVQQMQTILVPNTNISIPNNSQTRTFTQPLTFPLSNVWVWGVMGHTHKYGTGAKVFLRNSNGTKGTIVYDAACSGGVPGCMSPSFDYRHIPMRYFPEPYYQINMSRGVIHEASYLNNGPAPVSWGLTSNDEMMVLVIMYLLDTTGLNLAPTGIFDAEEVNNGGPLKISPNPFGQTAWAELPEHLQGGKLMLMDNLGRVVKVWENLNGGSFQMNAENIANGLYHYRLTDEAGNAWTGKVVVARE